jgi:prephenate dehydratase
MTIAFQGELGAYSEAAAKRLFEGADVRPEATFEDVFAALAAGEADRAVVPIENTVFGSVPVNYDHLQAHAVEIVGEQYQRIRHHLLASAGASLPSITTVRSHPQALGQCRTWLRSHLPDATIVPAHDTAGAARAIAEGDNPATAAIASAQAAARYGLDVLAAGLEDAPENYTRFLALARRDTGAARVGTGPLKTSVVFALRENVPGALAKSLTVFAERSLDLIKIESRPYVGQPGRYRFFADVDGDRHAPPLAAALKALQATSTDVHALGTYPAGTIGAGD